MWFTGLIDEEEAAMVGIDCEPTDIPDPGIKEGEHREVEGYNPHSMVGMNCKVDLYYHTGCVDESKKGWHKQDEYFDILRYKITDIAIVNGDIKRTFCTTFKDFDLKAAKSSVKTFFTNNDVAVGFWKAIEKDDYSEIINDYYTRNCGSGAVEQSSIVFDIVDLAIGFGVVKKIPKLLNFHRLIRKAGCKFSGRKVVTESGEILAEYSDNALRSIKFVDEGTSVKKLDEAIEYELNGTVKSGKLEIVESGGEKAFREIATSATKLADDLTGITKQAHANLVEGGVDFVDDGNVIKYFKKNGDEFAKITDGEVILTTSDGKWPDPSEYLDEEYIENHLAKFNNEGAIRFTTQSKLENFGTLGPDNAFVMPKSEFDDLIAETGGDLAEIEKKLNLNDGDLTGDNAVIAWIKSEDIENIKLPTGNEHGAIKGKWIPGGKTGGGISEAVMDLSDKNISYDTYPF